MTSICSKRTFSFATPKGRVWRDRLVELHGRDRSYVSVDAGEFLVYPGVVERGLPRFVGDLERSGPKRAVAPMLDIDRPSPIDRQRPDGSRTEDPFDGEAHFAGDGYSAANEKFCMSIRGDRAPTCSAATTA